MLTSLIRNFFTRDVIKKFTAQKVIKNKLTLNKTCFYECLNGKNNEYKKFKSHLKICI